VDGPRRRQIHTGPAGRARAGADIPRFHGQGRRRPAGGAVRDHGRAARLANGAGRRGLYRSTGGRDAGRRCPAELRRSATPHAARKSGSTRNGSIARRGGADRVSSRNR
jgi:hypothetical protein